MDRRLADSHKQMAKRVDMHISDANRRLNLSMQQAWKASVRDVILRSYGTAVMITCRKKGERDTGGDAIA